MSCQESSPGPPLKEWQAPPLIKIEEKQSFIKEGVWCMNLYADDELTQKIENRALYIDANDKNEWFVWYQEVSNPGLPEASPEVTLWCDNQDNDGWFCIFTGQEKRFIKGNLRLEGAKEDITYIFIKEKNKKEKLLGGMLGKCPDNFPYISFSDRVDDLKKIREWLY